MNFHFSCGGVGESPLKSRLASSLREIPSSASEERPIRVDSNNPKRKMTDPSHADALNNECLARSTRIVVSTELCGHAQLKPVFDSQVGQRRRIFSILRYSHLLLFAREADWECVFGWDLGKLHLLLL